jgi:hypothetical protein
VQSGTDVQAINDRSLLLWWLPLLLLCLGHIWGYLQLSNRLPLLLCI